MIKNLVKNQHVLPKMSIGRFTDSTGMVQLHRKKNKKTFRAHPNNKIFCFKQVWDQSSETRFGKNIEDSYQKLTEKVLLNNLDVLLNEEEHYIITKFYILWCLRFSIQNYDHLISGNVIGVEGSKDHNGHYLSEQQKHNIELNGGMYFEEDGFIPMRFKRGRTIQIALDQFIQRNPNPKWFICKSNELELIVSDNPHTEMIIPITSNLCFIFAFNLKHLTKEQVIKINLNTISRSKEYYFAKEFSRCIY